MSDTSSKHTIKYILELDESDVDALAKQVEDRVNARLAGRTGASGPAAGSGGPAAARPSSAVSPPSSPQTPAQQQEQTKPKKKRKPTAVEEESEKTLGETIHGSISRLVMRATGGSANTASAVASQSISMLQTMPGVGRAASWMMGATTAAAPFAAAAFAIYGLYKAAHLAAQALGQFAGGMITGNPVSMLQGTSAGLKSVATAGTVLTAGVGAPITVPLHVLGSVIGVVIGAMTSLTQTLGQYNAMTIGQMRVTDLMHRMLMITIGQQLQPALTAWQELLQKIMGDMARHPEIYKAVNDVLLKGIEILKIVWNALLDFVAGLKAAYYVQHAFAHPLDAYSDLKNAYGVLAARQQERDNPGGADDLKARALVFNRGFLLGMQQVAGGGGGGGSGGGGGGSLISRGFNMPHANMPLISANVSLDVQQKIMHEQAVQQAVEQIKDRLFGGLKTVRDEAKLLSAVIDGYSLGYGL
jgi:hypothetical protein